MGLLTFIKGVFGRMLSKDTIEKALRIETITSPEMETARDSWRRVIQGNSPWNVKNVVSQGFASAICAEFTRVGIADFEFDITDPADPRPEDEDEPWQLREGSMAAFLNRHFEEFAENTSLSETWTKLLEGGELILKATPLQNDIEWSTIENDCFRPTKYNTKGELIGFVTWETFVENKHYYTLLENINYDEKTRIYTIEYTAWVSDNEKEIGRQINLTDVEQWAELEPSISVSNTSKWFVHIKMPLKNNIDRSGRFGVSIIQNALQAGIFQKLDETAELSQHEINAGRLKQQVYIDMIRNIKNKAVERDIDSDLFTVFDAESEDINKAITTYNPNPRIDYYRQFDNILLRRLETLSQLSFGIFSDVSTQDKTATEVMHSKERFYNMNLNIQKTWDDAFQKMLNIMYEIALLSTTDGNTFITPTPQGEYVASFTFGDSIMSDRVTEMQERIQAQNAGWLSAVEGRSWYTGESIVKASRNIPGSFDETS